MNNFSKLVVEMMEANNVCHNPLDMSTWVDEEECGTPCCACGSVVLARGSDNLEGAAIDFADELTEASREVFGSHHVAESVIGGSARLRTVHAIVADFLFLDHPHLCEDHDDRSILQDYLQKVLEISEAKTCSQ